MSKKVICHKCGETCASRIEPYTCQKCKKFSPEEKRQRRSEAYRKWKYDLENGEFDALWIIFKGRCGICNNLLKMPTPGQGQALDVVAVDHDHSTGQVRGLLCNSCNKGIGLFNDNPEKLINAARYLSYGKKIGNS